MAILVPQTHQKRFSSSTFPILLQAAYVPWICLSGPAVGAEVGQYTVGRAIYSFGTAGVMARNLEH